MTAQTDVVPIFHDLQRASAHRLRRAPYDRARIIREFMGQSSAAPVGVNDSVALYAMLDHTGRVQYFDLYGIDRMVELGSQHEQ